MTRLLTDEQAAKRLQVSKDTIQRARLSGKLRFARIGRSVRIDPDDLDAYVATTKTGGGRGERIDVFAPNPNYRPPSR